ncbi:MAG: hypothetical protein ABJG15_16120, partial [Hyphomonadaceae bacterium]
MSKNEKTKLPSAKKALLASSAAAALLMTFGSATANAQIVIDNTTMAPVNPDDNQTVTVAAGVSSTVGSGDNILVDSGAADVVITIDGTLINTDGADENTVVFVDNGETGTIINNNGQLFGNDGVVFVEGDNVTLNNTGLIAGVNDDQTEGVVYLDRDAEGTFTINNSATGIIETQAGSGGGPAIGLDGPALDADGAQGASNSGVVATIVIDNAGIIRDLEGDDSDADAININGDPGSSTSCDPCSFDINITNSGTISAIRTSSSNAAIRFEDDAQFLTGTISNTATGVISGGNNGIYIGSGVDTDGGLEIATHGGIIENAGLITATADRAIRVDGGGITINNLAGGTITGPGEGIYFDQGSGDDAGLSGGTVNNAGTISSADSAVSIRGQSGTILNNTGSLLGLTGGSARSVLEITGQGDNITILNGVDGDITAQTGFAEEAVGIAVGNASGDSRTISFTNAGTIAGLDGAGVVVSSDGAFVGNVLSGASVFTNSGTIQSTGGTALVVDNVSVLPTITNSGTLSGVTNSFDASGATSAITFEQQGGALVGNFLGTTGFTDTLNFTTANFTLASNILQSVNTTVANGVTLDVDGARMIDGDLTSNGTIAFLLGTDTLDVTGDVTLNTGSVVSVDDSNGQVTAVGQQFTLITSGGTLTNDSTLATTAVDSSFLL